MSSAGTSPLHALVIRAILSGHESHRALAGAMKGHISGDALRALINRMHRELGLIHSRRGGWVVSPKGLELIPSAVVVQPMRPYVPPPPMPVREGSLAFLRLPSIAGGRLYVRGEA